MKPRPGRKLSVRLTAKWSSLVSWLWDKWRRDLLAAPLAPVVNHRDQSSDSGGNVPRKCEKEGETWDVSMNVGEWKAVDHPRVANSGLTVKLCLARRRDQLCVYCKHSEDERRRTVVSIHSLTRPCASLRTCSSICLPCGGMIAMAIHFLAMYHQPNHWRPHSEVQKPSHNRLPVSGETARHSDNRHQCNIARLASPPCGVARSANCCVDVYLTIGCIKFSKVTQLTCPQLFLCL